MKLTLPNLILFLLLVFIAWLNAGEISAQSPTTSLGFQFILTIPITIVHIGYFWIISKMVVPMIIGDGVFIQEKHLPHARGVVLVIVLLATGITYATVFFAPALFPAVPDFLAWIIKPVTFTYIVIFEVLMCIEVIVLYVIGAIEYVIHTHGGTS